MILLGLLAARWGTNPLVRRLLHLGPSRLSTGARLRRIVERMGVTYTKLGQFLAMRFDVLPADVCFELDRLFEEAPHVPLHLLLRQLEAELGAPVETVFASFDELPIAAASVSQVHRAVTKSGETVAVKVQRPGIEEIFRSDIRLLTRTARLADRLGLFGNLPSVDLVEQFAAFTAQELDFRVEGMTAEEVRRQSDGLGVRIPRVHWELSTQRVLTMEFVEGVSALWVCQAGETAGVRAIAERLPGVDLHAFINTLGRACLHHMFVSGLFHGDPHPGNILVGPDGRPVLLDFGIFGRLDRDIRILLARFYECLSHGNIRDGARYYLRICPPTDETDLHTYQSELATSLREWYEVTRMDRGTVRERHPFRFVGDIVGAMRRNSVRMPSDQLLFWRALTTLGSVALRWPARFDLTATLRAFFEEQRPPTWERVAEAARGVSLPGILGAAEGAPGRLAASVRRASTAPEVGWRTRAAPIDERDDRYATAAAMFALLGVAAAMAAAGLPEVNHALGLIGLLLSLTMLGLAVGRRRRR